MKMATKLLASCTALCLALSLAACSAADTLTSNAVGELLENDEAVEALLQDEEKVNALLENEAVQSLLQNFLQGAETKDDTSTTEAQEAQDTEVQADDESEDTGYSEYYQYVLETEGPNGEEIIFYYGILLQHETSDGSGRISFKVDGMSTAGEVWGSYDSMSAFGGTTGLVQYTFAGDGMGVPDVFGYVDYMSLSGDSLTARIVKYNDSADDGVEVYEYTFIKQDY